MNAQAHYSSVQADVMAALEAHGPCTVTQIAQYTGRTKQNITETVRDLHKCKFVRVYGTVKAGYGNVARIWEAVE